MDIHTVNWITIQYWNPQTQVGLEGPRWHADRQKGVDFGPPEDAHRATAGQSLSLVLHQPSSAAQPVMLTLHTMGYPVNCQRLSKNRQTRQNSVAFPVISGPRDRTLGKHRENVDRIQGKSTRLANRPVAGGQSAAKPLSRLPLVRVSHWFNLRGRHTGRHTGIWASWVS